MNTVFTFTTLIFSLLHSLLMCIQLYFKSDSISHRNTVPVCLIAFTGYFITFFLNYGMTYYFYNCFMFLCIVTFLYLSYINDDSMIRNVFLTVLSVNPMFLANLITMTMYSIYSHSTPAGFMTYVEFVLANQLRTAIITFLTDLIIACVSVFLLNRFRKYLDNRLMITFSIMTILPSFLLMYYETITGLMFYDHSLSSVLNACVIIFTMILSVICLLFCYQKTAEIQRKDIEMKLLESTVSSSEQILSMYQQIRDLKHDMKQYINTIRYTRNTSAEIENIIAQYEHIVQNDDSFYTGYPAVDYVLNSKKREAADRGLDFRISLQLPDHLTVDSSDLFLMLSNLLDNAFRHGVSSETVQFRIWHTTDTVYYQTVNGIDPAATPPNYAVFMGTGIRTIRSICEKYDGVCSFQTTDHSFIAMASTSHNTEKR